MAQNKTGLHKKVSSIFDGVPVPKETDAQQPSASPPVDFKGPLPPRSPVGGVHMKPLTKMSQDSAARSSRPDVFHGEPRQSISEYIIEKLGALNIGQFADKQKIKMLIIPALAILLILVLYRNFTGMSRSPVKTPDVQNVANRPYAAVAAPAIVWLKPEPYPVYMRDPTQLSAAGAYAAGAGSIAVKGIVYSEDRPSAVIGGEIKHEGDTIGDVTIVKINRDGVEFRVAGKTWTQKVQ